MKRCSSSFSVLMVAEFMTMNGSSKPDRAGVHERRLRDVQLRARRPVERLQHLGVQLVELRALSRTHADRVGEKELAHAALAEEGRDLAHDFVETWNRPQRVEGGAIGRMFPGAR